jgi:hypothetical protein
MKKIYQKIFQSKSPISNWLLILIVYVALAMFLTIIEQSETIEQEQFIRICPEPYVCIVPPENWKGKVPMGLTHYKRIEV